MKAADAETAQILTDLDGNANENDPEEDACKQKRQAYLTEAEEVYRSSNMIEKITYLIARQIKRFLNQGTIDVVKDSQEYLKRNHGS